MLISNLITIFFIYNIYWGVHSKKVPELPWIFQIVDEFANFVFAFETLLWNVLDKWYLVVQIQM